MSKKPELQMTAHDSIEDVLFTAVRYKTTELIPDFTFSQQLSHVIYIPEKNRMVNFCTSDYKVRCNIDLIEPIYEKCRKQYGDRSIKTVVKSYDARRFYVEIHLIGAECAVLEGNDKVYPSISVWNSYDGRLRTKIAAGLYRQVCMNGLMALETDFSIEKKHVGGELNLERIMKFIEHAKPREGLVRIMKVLTGRRITELDLQKIKNLVREKTRFPRRLIEGVDQIIHDESRKLKVPLNAFLAYNGFNRQLQEFQNPKLKLSPENRVVADKEVLKVVSDYAGMN